MKRARLERAACCAHLAKCGRTSIYVPVVWQETHLRSSAPAPCSRQRSAASTEGRSSFGPSAVALGTAMPPYFYWKPGVPAANRSRGVTSTARARMMKVDPIRLRDFPIHRVALGGFALASIIKSILLSGSEGGSGRSVRMSES